MSSLSRLRRVRPSAGVVIGIIALVFAMGGAAVALPGKNKVDKNDIAKNAVTTKTLKNGAVTGAKLGAGAVTADKLGAGAVTDAKLANGAVTTAKLADNAVTGAKVDEASLGTVPAAAKADTAEKANTAQSAATAQTADKANTATSAGTAAKASDAEALEGRPLLQVRSLGVGNSDTSSQGLDDANYEEVIPAPLVNIPTGGADLIVSASVELVNNGGGQAGAQCELRDDGAKISANYSVTIPAGFSTSVSLTGFADNLPASGLVDPENVGVFCQGSIADDTVSFTEGDIVVQRIPIGA